MKDFDLEKLNIEARVNKILEKERFKHHENL